MSDPVEDGVTLLHSIGLDATYTDDGLVVIVKQIQRAAVQAERERILSQIMQAVKSL